MAVGLKPRSNAVTSIFPTTAAASAEGAGSGVTFGAAAASSTGGADSGFGGKVQVWPVPAEHPAARRVTRTTGGSAIDRRMTGSLAVRAGNAHYHETHIVTICESIVRQVRKQRGRMTRRDWGSRTRSPAVASRPGCKGVGYAVRRPATSLRLTSASRSNIDVRAPVKAS